MLPLHGQLTLPFRTVLNTWLWTRLHLVAIGTVFFLRHDVVFMKGYVRGEYSK